MQKERLEAQQNHLRFLNQRHAELNRKTAILNKAAQFTQRAGDLGLQRSSWTFYDVNVQAPLGYEAAQEMIYQCSDSSLAYFWPISLEIKAPEKDQKTGAANINRMGPADVLLSVKGRFVAKP